MTHYINFQARLGEVFGVFATHDGAVKALRSTNRSLNTHTICRVGNDYVVRAKGY